MIGNVVIENFKSITKLELELGRINVLIGANGCGKSNILEAIAVCSAAAEDKLDQSFLVPRGIRVPDEAKLWPSAFQTDSIERDIRIGINSRSPELVHVYRLIVDNSSPYPVLKRHFRKSDLDLPRLKEYFAPVIDKMAEQTGKTTQEDKEEFLDKIFENLGNSAFGLGELVLQNFFIFSPEYRILRNFEEEGQLVPLGIHGEGLLKLLTVMSSSFLLNDLTELKEQLRLIDWFEDFDFSPTVAFGDRSLRIKDKYFDPALPEMSQRSSNEGFLFLLFYFTLFISDLTPKFFAVDNVDASLNPKLCARLMVQLTELAKKHDKQAIFTTHNPAVLDGLNLDDDEQRIFVVYRNRNGHTTVKRVQKPQPIEGVEPVRLSEMFMRGYIGGLPNNF